MKKYITNLLEEPSQEDIRNIAPLVTLSREAGCSANGIAQKLAQILQGYSFDTLTGTQVTWRWINKEILEETAQEEDISPEKVQETLNSHNPHILEEVKEAFSTENQYASHNQRVIGTARKVITRFVEEGHCVLVGRGSTSLVLNHPNALRIKLQAPLQWRINRAMNTENLTGEEALEFIEQLDNQRDAFAKNMAGHKLSPSDYDLLFNCATMTDDAIIEAILTVMKSRFMI